MTFFKNVRKYGICVANIVVLLLLLFFIIAASVILKKQKKSRKSSCGAGCNSCPYSSGCKEKKEDIIEFTNNQ